MTWHRPPGDVIGTARRSLGSNGVDVDLARAVRTGTPLGGSGDLLAALHRARAEILGAGPLQELLTDPDVTDIVVNGPGPVWVDRGYGVVRSNIRVDDEATLRRLAERLVSSSGRRLDEASPFADVRLADGTRVHAALPSVAPQGTTLSLRVPPRRTFTLDELVRRGALRADAAGLLRRLVVSRVAFVVSGGTGTGKTTLLSTLLSQAPDLERIVLVEDTAELAPRHPHVVRLQSRTANAEGAGEIDLACLVRQALRMRPDRLVVGEVRGAEVVDLLAAMNTGHEGGASTLHANRAQAVPARFEALCAAAGLPRAAAHAQLAAAVQAVVHLTRGGDGLRRVAGVAVLTAEPDDVVRVVAAQRFTAAAMVPGPAAAALDALLDAE